MADETNEAKLGRLIAAEMRNQGAYIVRQDMLDILHEAIEMSAKIVEQVGGTFQTLVDHGRVTMGEAGEAIEMMEEGAAVFRKVRGLLMEVTDYTGAAH